MSTTVTAPPRSDCPSLILGKHLAALLPDRAGAAWTVTPASAWWSTKPAARLEQGGRALVVVARPWDTEIAWELPGRTPYEPDLRLMRMDPVFVAREVLRLVLPVVDDEAAGARVGGPRVVGRLELLNEIGAAMRAQGAATYNRVGLLADTSTLAWSCGELRLSVTMHGMNPACNVQVHGPVRAVERAVSHFLPEATGGRPGLPTGVRGRLQRRIGAYLARHGDVEQTEQGGIAFGTRPGPYGYAAPALDPATRAHDTTLVSVDLHSVGVDLLVSLAPRLAR
ncbi:hypothetical protein ABZ804_21840 [Streptomyces sp. NPDC047726]|uniref:hypothetical protein n=1 Tax=unclassified Streptomyces TaxID=2593676 RepID=UPI0033C23A48